MNIILFVLVNLMVLFSSYHVIINFERSKINYRMKIVDLSMVYMFSILLITYILGFIIKKYNVYSIFIVSLIYLVVTLIVLKIRKRNYSIKILLIEIKEKICEIIINLKLRYNSLNKIYKTIVILFFIALVIKIAMLGFLRVYDWDGLKYHLATLPNYIQDEYISMNETIIWSNTYPRNFEMLNMWILVFFRNSFLIKLPNFLIPFIGSLAAYDLLKRFKIDSNKALLGSFLFLTMPVFTSQMNTVYIDAALTMLIIIAVNNCLSYLENDDWLTLTVFAIAISILIGIKFTALVYAGIIGIVFAIVLWRKRGFLNLLTKLIYVIPFLLIGSIWYIWDLIYFGNPLFPFGYSIGSFVLFKGLSVNDNIVDTNAPVLYNGKSKIFQVFLSWLGIGDGWLDVLTPKYDGRVGAFGILWIINVISAIILFIKSIINKDNIIYIVLVLCSIIMLIITPANWWARYVGYLSILGIIGLMWALTNGNKNIKKILNVIIIIMFLQNCFASVSRDCYYGYRVVKNYKNNDVSSYFYNQLTDDYEKWLFNNIGLDECSIVSFRNDVGGFNLFGENSANKYKYYYSTEVYDPYDNEAFNKLSVIDDQEAFDQALEKNQPDYILDNSNTVNKYIENYNSKYHKNYTLVANKENELIYKKNIMA